MDLDGLMDALEYRGAAHQTHEARGRPARMMFEAKRFYRTNSVAQYAGRDGLGAFVDGTYGHEAKAAAMLGYIQKPRYENAPTRIEHKLSKERTKHRLAPEGEVWCSAVQDERLPSTMRSQHNRAGFGLLDIYHSFLKCY